MRSTSCSTSATAAASIKTRRCDALESELGPRGSARRRLGHTAWKNRRAHQIAEQARGLGRLLLGKVAPVRVERLRVVELGGTRLEPQNQLPRRFAVDDADAQHRIPRTAD